MALIKATIVSIVILIIWQWAEYRQFGELQLNRHCDDLVFIIYFVVLWYAFSR